MENNCKCKIFAIIAISVAVTCGLLCFGSCSLSRWLASKNMIEGAVKGLSERVVKADIGEIFIKIENQNPNLKDLYTKRTEDKKKTLDFLKKNWNSR